MHMKSLLPKPLGPSNRGRDVFRDLHSEIERVFDEFNRGFMSPSVAGGWGGVAGAVMPRIDVAEQDDGMEVSVELPGVEKDNVDISVSGDILTIKGEKKSEREDQNKEYHVIERSFGSFQRSVRLPFEADADKISADFKDGLLKIKVGISPEVEAKTKKIPIQAN